MSKLLLVIAVTTLFLATGNQVAGAEQDDVSGPLDLVALEDKDEGAVRARTAHGVIRSIDLENRMAEISGYNYSFGGYDDELPAQVKMVGSEYGALELLRPEMKVEINFNDTGEIRMVVTLQQLADNAVIEVF